MVSLDYVVCEVNIKALNNMRFSSVLLASFTMSAGLSWAAPMVAQASELASSEEGLSHHMASDNDENDSEIVSNQVASLPLASLDVLEINQTSERSRASLDPAGSVHSFVAALPEPTMQWALSESQVLEPASLELNADTIIQPNNLDASQNVTVAQAEPSEPDSPEGIDDTPEESVNENEPDADVTDESPVEGANEQDQEPEVVEEAPEPRVLVAEVRVVGVEEQLDLEEIIYEAIETTPGRTTTRSQLQEDINSIFATGFFSNVEATPEDTPLGVRITFDVVPNPLLADVRVSNSALQDQGVTLFYEDPDAPFGAEPEQLTISEIVERIFSPQYGSTLNLLDFQDGIERLNETYQRNGYVLAQVVDAPPPQDGIVTIEVAEGVIEDINVAFLDEDGLDVDEEGNPIEGRTRDFIITREFESQPGDVFNQQNIQRDLQQVFGLGIFDDVRVALNPGDDPRKVDVIVNVIEGNTGSVAAGVGFSSASGVFGSASYQQQNLGGNNQRLGAEVQFGTREILFDVRFTDPWIAGDPFRTSYTVNAFSRRSISLIFDGGDNEVELDNGDRPRVQRLGGGVSFSRPLDEWLGWDDWRASTGFQYQRVSIRDADGDLEPEDELGNDLSFSGSGQDDLFTLQLGAVRDRRNNAAQPTQGSLLRLGSEQSIPFGSGSIFFNRLRVSYSRYIPVSFTNFSDGPEALAFNVQSGTVIGDLPPYEAFSLGGTDSVRGYDAGDLGSGRSFIQATAEYRFPVFSFIGGALFFDFGSDLGTGEDVPGEPAEIRDKPGTGFGYGIGVRVQSPLGPIRLDFGINDEGDNRVHFGIGERF
ncbi:MAG: BamA/TamA family outer membrane protein [Cyanobacteria bacterium J06633_2]